MLLRNLLTGLLKLALKSRCTVLFLLQLLAIPERLFGLWLRLRFSLRGGFLNGGLRLHRSRLVIRQNGFNTGRLHLDLMGRGFIVDHAICGVSRRYLSGLPARTDLRLCGDELPLIGELWSHSPSGDFLALGHALECVGALFLNVRCGHVLLHLHLTLLRRLRLRVRLGHTL